MSHIERSKNAARLFFRVKKQFEIKDIEAECGDFGDLHGFQFDSEKFGGFVYFWSSGFVEYHLVDYKSECEIIPLTSKCIELDEVAMSEIMLLVAAIESLG